MERERKKMKTCNGCDCLYAATQQLSHYRVVCGYNQRGQEIGWFYGDEPIPTPYWCPKKNENIQKEALNVN